MRIAPLLAALPLLAPLAAHAAGPIGPTRASEALTLVASYDPPGCTGGLPGEKLDRVLRPDGTYATLVIPPKRVLVLTEIRWSTLSPLAANEDVTVNLRPGADQPGIGGIPLPGARLDANGRGSGQAKLEPGVVMRSAADLCVTLFSSDGPFAPGNLSGSGFFAKDK
jgi:hypothetical protein